MMHDGKKGAGWKKRLVHELTEYWITFIYLALFFGVFTTYRRLILEYYHIGYGEYGFAIIKALILAKVILIADAMHVGRRLEDRPLIIPTLYKTVLFTLWVVLFSVVEATVDGLLHGKGLAGGLKELLSGRKYEVLGDALVVFSAFIPFFAFKELSRVMGEGKIRELFLGRK